ncbi:hypothetical protein RFI_38885, partial [Reticulomyxa filosa]
VFCVVSFAEPLKKKKADRTKGFFKLHQRRAKKKDLRLPFQILIVQENNTSEMFPKGHRCLYEILEIPRTANLSEIRAAYKTLVQKWHPDKNQSNIEEVSQRFRVCTYIAKESKVCQKKVGMLCVIKEINEAYEMLSGENEHKWYDAHREQLLSENKKQPSNTTKHKEEEEEEEFDIVPYLWPWAFSTFDQTKPNNFYQVFFFFGSPFFLKKKKKGIINYNYDWVTLFFLEACKKIVVCVDDEKVYKNLIFFFCKIEIILKLHIQKQIVLNIIFYLQLSHKLSYIIKNFLKSEQNKQINNFSF